MTAYKLIREYTMHNPSGHYFDRDTLKFFGECISNMRVLKNTVVIRDSLNNLHVCYVLSKYSRNYPGGGRRTYGYFDVNTFEDVIPGND